MSGIGEKVLAGMGAAGWLIGFLALLGGFLIVAGALVLLCIEIGKSWDEEEAADGGQTAPGGDGVRGHAKTVGRDDRPRARDDD